MDFEILKQHRQSKSLFCQKLGISIDELQAGYATVRKIVEENDVNPLGLPHGGLYFSMADYAAGTAMATHGYQAVTLNCSFNFFRSASVGDSLIAEAAEIKSGNTICVFDVTVKNQSNTLLASGTFTFFQTGIELSL